MNVRVGSTPTTSTYVGSEATGPSGLQNRRMESDSPHSRQCFSLFTVKGEL